MKKLIIACLSFILVSAAGFAQGKYVVVNSEKIFKAVPKYTQAIEALDKLSEQYQKGIDDEFAKIEQMYNEYQSQKAYLSQSNREMREQAILTKEKEVNDYQKSLFGPEGSLLRKRMETLKPIQDAVFTIINTYASKNGYDLVIDSATNPSLLYINPLIDKTEDIVKIVKQQ